VQIRLSQSGFVSQRTATPPGSRQTFPAHAPVSHCQSRVQAEPMLRAARQVYGLASPPQSSPLSQSPFPLQFVPAAHFCRQLPPQSMPT
jgi:hypothetical protein